MLVTLSCMGMDNAPIGFLKKITKQILLHEDEFFKNKKKSYKIPDKKANISLK